MNREGQKDNLGGAERKEVIRGVEMRRGPANGKGGGASGLELEAVKKVGRRIR